jgi:hypothetical protein
MPVDGFMFENESSFEIFAVLCVFSLRLCVAMISRGHAWHLQ